MQRIRIASLTFLVASAAMSQTNPACNIVTGFGPQSGAPPRVKMYTANGAPLATNFLAYGSPGYGVNVATGEFDLDGVREILTGAGPGPSIPGEVRGWDELGNMLFNFMTTSGYGVNVAAGNLDFDAYDEILTGPGPGTVFGPQVRGWKVGGTPMSKVNFFAYSTIKYGVNVGAGDVDGDSFDEILTGPGPGAIFPATVRGFNYDGTAIAAIAGLNVNAFTGGSGCYPSAGEIDGDLYDEVLVGQGPGLSTNDGLAGFNVDGGTATSLFSIDAYLNKNVNGVRCEACDLDADGTEEILSGPRQAPFGIAQVRGWNWDGGPIASIGTTQFNASLGFGATVAGGDYGF